MDMGKYRNSNFEFLRIVAMLLIVMYHYVIHGGFIWQSDFTFNKSFLQTFGMGGKTGVDIFVLISGYFLIYKKIEIKKLFKIIFHSLIYSLIILIIVWIFNIKPIDLKDIISSVLPFGIMYWFVNAYIILYLLFPYFNLFLKKLRHDQYLTLLILGLFIWYIIPTFLFRVTDMQFSNMISFFYLYALGAYFRIFYERCNFIYAKRLLFIGLFGYISITWLISFIGSITSLINIKRGMFLATDYSVFMLFISVGLFLYFKSKIMPYNKIINLISSTMLGVYLIHNNGLIKRNLWQDLFQNPNFYESEFLVIHAVGSVFIVFIISIFIDLLYLRYIEKPLFNYWDPYIRKLEIKIASKKFIFLRWIIKNLNTKWTNSNKNYSNP